MQTFIRLLSLIIFITTTQPLFAVYMGNRDYEDELTGTTVKKREIIVDFNKTKPLDNGIEFIHLDQSELSTKIESRISVSALDGYKKSNLEILFRNIETANQLIAVCVALKALKYTKFSLDDPSIFFKNSENASLDVKNQTNTARDKYNEDVLT